MVFIINNIELYTYKDLPLDMQAKVKKQAEKIAIERGVRVAEVLREMQECIFTISHGILHFATFTNISEYQD